MFKHVIFVPRFIRGCRHYIAIMHPSCNLASNKRIHFYSTIPTNPSNVTSFTPCSSIGLGGIWPSSYGLGCTKSLIDGVSLTACGGTTVCKLSMQSDTRTN